VYEYDDMDIVTMTQSPSYRPSHHEPVQGIGAWSLDDITRLLTSSIGYTDRTLFASAHRELVGGHLGVAGGESLVVLTRTNGPKKVVREHHLFLAFHDCLHAHPDAVWYDRLGRAWVMDSATADAIMQTAAFGGVEYDYEWNERRWVHRDHSAIAAFRARVARMEAAH
jgi:hypothetical protein